MLRCRTCVLGSNSVMEIFSFGDRNYLCGKAIPIHPKENEKQQQQK